LAGSFLGARILPKANTQWLRLVFGAVILFLAIQMIYKGATGGI
jgi:uncharacterized membrane protein YfcA